MVFLIDLPRLSKEGRASAVSTPFLEDLCYFLTNQGIDEAMIRSIRNFDYSATARYAFVHTMYGSLLCCLRLYDYRETDNIGPDRIRTMPGKKQAMQGLAVLSRHLAGIRQTLFSSTIS